MDTWRVFLVTVIFFLGTLTLCTESPVVWAEEEENIDVVSYTQIAPVPVEEISTETADMEQSLKTQMDEQHQLLATAVTDEERGMIEQHLQLLQQELDLIQYAIK